MGEFIYQPGQICIAWAMLTGQNGSLALRYKEIGGL